MEDHNWNITPWLLIILMLIFWGWDFNIEIPIPELDAWENRDLQEFFEGDD